MQHCLPPCSRVCTWRPLLPCLLPSELLLARLPASHPHVPSPPTALHVKLCPGVPVVAGNAGSACPRTTMLRPAC